MVKVVFQFIVLGLLVLNMAVSIYLPLSDYLHERYGVEFKKAPVEISNERGLSTDNQSDDEKEPVLLLGKDDYINTIFRIEHTDYTEIGYLPSSILSKKHFTITEKVINYRDIQGNEYPSFFKLKLNAKNSDLMNIAEKLIAIQIKNPNNHQLEIILICTHCELQNQKKSVKTKIIVKHN
jgi:hypothetical protein